MYQAIPHNAKLLQQSLKCKDASSVCMIREFSPEGIKEFKNYVLNEKQKEIARNVSKLLSEVPDLLSRCVDNRNALDILHFLCFDNPYGEIIEESPELIFTAIFGKYIIDCELGWLRYTPPSEISQIVKCLSDSDSKRLEKWFPILRDKGLPNDPYYTFEEAMLKLNNAMNELLEFYKLVLEQEDEGVIVDLS